MQKMKILLAGNVVALTAFLGLAIPAAQAQSQQMANANKAYVKCLVNAFSHQAGQSRATKATLTAACKAQEKNFSMQFTIKTPVLSHGLRTIMPELLFAE